MTSIDETTDRTLFDSIKPGDIVTIETPQGQCRKGHTVMFNPQYGSWVLNLGGAHGTPGIATVENTVAVKTPPARKRKVTFRNR